jgi:ion channel-forming bestrophin family protein
MVIGTRLPWWNVIKMHAPILGVVAALAIAVSTVERVYGLRPPSAPLPFSVAGFALAIFLAFRNSASYERWWEGRKLWGGIVNASRALARQTITFVGGDEAVAAELRRDVIYRHLAYVNALRCQLRAEDPLPALAPFLDDAERAALVGQKNVAAALLHANGARIADAAGRGALSEERLAAIDRSLVEIVNMQGGCERIKSTPLPAAYGFFTRTFVRVYCLVLPFGLVEHMGYATVLVVTALSFVLLVLETIGRLLEDPFTLAPNGLPLSAICRNIEINLRQQLGEADVPPALQPESRGVFSILT